MTSETPSSAPLLEVAINGARHALPRGWSLLDALRAARVDVPALCDDERLVPSGACRTCLVHVKGSDRPVPACTTPLVDGMDIETDLPEVIDARRSVLEMLASRYPADAIGRFPDKPFHRAVIAAGLRGAAVMGLSRPDVEDRSHPYIAVDMARCIDCYRCVRICEEVQGHLQCRD